MTRLLYAFEAARTLNNARKLYEYDRQHIMAACMLTPREHGILADAIAMWTEAKHEVAA